MQARYITMRERQAKTYSKRLPQRVNCRDHESVGLVVTRHDVSAPKFIAYEYGYGLHLYNYDTFAAKYNCRAPHLWSLHARWDNEGEAGQKRLEGGSSRKRMSQGSMFPFQYHTPRNTSLMR